MDIFPRLPATTLNVTWFWYWMWLDLNILPIGCRCLYCGRAFYLSIVLLIFQGDTACLASLKPYPQLSFGLFPKVVMTVTLRD